MVVQTHDWKSVATGAQNDGVDLRDVISRLWQARRTVGLAGVAGMVTGMLVYLGSAPVYQADALLQLESRSAALSLPSALTAQLDDDPHTVTEIEILRSRMVLGEAVARLNLDWHVAPQRAPLIGTYLAQHDVTLPDAGFLRPYARKGDVIELDGLQVPDGWIGARLELTAGTGGGYVLRLPDGRLLQGQVGQTLTDAQAGLVLRVGKLAAPEGRRFDLVQRSRTAAIADLRSRLGVTETTRQSFMLRLTYADASPAEAEQTLDAVAQAYLRQNINRSSAEAASSLAFIESNLLTAEAAVSAAETALNDFRRSNQAIDLDFEVQAMLSQTAALKSQLETLNREETAMRQRYTPSHPAYRQLLADKSHLESQLVSLQDQISRLPGTQRELVKLTGALDAAQENYMQLSIRAQELRVMQASKIGNVRIVDLARATGAPVSPRLSRILPFWTVTAMIAAAAVVLLRNWLRVGITRAADLETLGLGVFAVVQYMRGLGNRRSRRLREIFALNAPRDAAIESFRSMRTSLHFSMTGTRNTAVLLTGATPDVGKSFCAENLAVVSAMAGQRVCLVDGDMRRGTAHLRFGVKRSHPGLSSYLEGTADLDSILVKGPLDGLWLIPTGPLPHNPSELLMNSRLAALVAELNRRFDLTVIDSPPALNVTDPVLIGKEVGATLLIARHNRTTPSELTAVRGLMAAAGVQITGAVLNCYDPRSSTEAYGAAYSRYYAYARAKT